MRIGLNQSLNTAGRKKTNIYESQKITADGTQLKAGGNIRINVDDDGKRLDSGDVTFEGSTLAAGDDVLVAADGDINVYAAQTYNMQRSETHKQSLGGLKKKSTGSRNERSGLKSSTLKATNDLSAISGNNITIVASDLESGGNTVLAAEKDILISAGADTEQQSTWSLKTDVMSGGDFYSIDANVAGTSSVKARRSNVQAGSNLTITAGSAKVVGSNLNAGNDITATTTTGDLDILATQDKTEHYSRDVSAGLSFSDMFAFNGQSSNESFEKMIDGSGDLNNTDKVIVWDNKGQPQINNLSLISNDANSQSSQTRSIGSQLTAGNNISVHSFNDLTSEATQFKAGHDIALSAQEDMTLKAAHNEDHHVEQNTQKGSFDKQKTDIVEDHIITAEGNQLNAGANIRINVDALGHQQDSGDVSFEGSQLNAGKDVLLAADGDINVYAAQTYELHREEHHKKSTLGLKKDNVGERNERQGLDGSTLKATDDLSVLSGNDITIVASDVNSGGDTHLEAFNNVLISAGEEVEKTESWTEKSNTFSDGKLYSLDEEREGEASIKAQSSHVQAGGNITLTAGRAKVVGSNLTAGGSIEAKTDIGDIEILAAKETSESFSHEKHVSASIADAMGNPDDIIQDDEEGKLKLKLADAVYDDEKTRTSKIEHTSSELVANEDITLEAIGDLLIEGSNIIADADRNQIGDVNLTAEENIIIQEAENLLTKIKEEKHGEAVLSFVVQHQAIEVIRALKNVKDAKKQVKQAQEDYRAYKKDIKRLEVELAAIAQDYKDKTPGITYDDVVEMREIVEATKDDEDWYKAGVVAATVNMAAKVTAVIQQTVALATSTGTYGFNAGVQLDVKGSKSRTEEHQSTSLASNIVGQNITIQTGGDEAQGSQTTIQGSHLQANNAINIDTGQLNIQASKDSYQMTKDTESIEISVQQTVYGAAGGPSVSGSLERSRDKAAESTYNNSTLNANNISLNSTDDTNIRGANVHANEQLMVDVGGDLNVESKQNRSRSSSVGASISGGFSFGGAEGDQASGTKSAAENGKSFSGAAKNLANLGGSNGKVSSVNVGASSNNSRSRSKETVLTSLTSGGSADINVKKNTHITGALIATQDENGKDLGNLNLTTKTLTYADLNNLNESSSRSTGISTSVGINSSANPADPAQQDAPDAQGEDNLRVNTTNIQHSNSSHYDKSKTLATLGQGNITIADEDNSDDLDRLNRDVDNVDKDIVSVDRSKGNIDLTVDHRMLSEEGRAEIVNDINTIKEKIDSRLPGYAKREAKRLKADMLNALQTQYTEEQAQEILAGIEEAGLLEQYGQLTNDYHDDNVDIEKLFGQPSESDPIQQKIDQNLATQSQSLPTETSQQDVVQATGPMEEVYVTVEDPNKPFGNKVADFAANSKEYVDSLEGWKKEGALFAMSAVTGPVKATVSFAVGKGIEIATPESAQEAIAEISENFNRLAGEGGVSVLTDEQFAEVDQKYEEGHQKTSRRVDGVAFFADQVLNILPGRKGKHNESGESGIGGNTNKHQDNNQAKMDGGNDKATVLKENKAKGDAFEQETIADLKTKKDHVTEQITVKTSSGTKTRIDAVTRDKDGNIGCVECKSSDTAPLTRNQKKAFPEIEESGAIVVGKGKPGFEGGTEIPPTKVEIIRPQKAD